MVKAKSKVLFTGTAAELTHFLAEHPEVQKKNIKIVEKEKEVKNEKTVENATPLC